MSLGVHHWETGSSDFDENEIKKSDNNWAHVTNRAIIRVALTRLLQKVQINSSHCSQTDLGIFFTTPKSSSFSTKQINCSSR